MGIRLTALAALLVAAAAAPARSQILDAPREYAKALVEATTPRWEGQEVGWPAPRPRPPAAHVLRGSLWPVAVHAAPGVPTARAEATLEALEAAAASFHHAGWPAPVPDGGHGGTGGFDLYLAPLQRGLADAFADAPVPWAHYDAVSTHAVVDPATPSDALTACVAEAYLHAVLLGQDPAEARSWHRATATFGAWRMTGEWGCDNAVDRAQQRPWRAWVDDDAPGDDANGALLLAMLSDRMAGARDTFVRDLWQLVRQRSRGTDRLRGTPDVWQALALMLDAAGGSLREMLADVAVARYFAGARSSHAPLPSLRELGADATVPVRWRAGWDALPARSPPADPPLAPTGSAHALVDVTAAPDDALIRVWLRGEYGVRWALTAVRLDAEGRPLSRMDAPEREVPRSYLPVQLTPDTAQVLLVVTNLSSRIPDADVPDENVRAFRLTVDRGDAHDALGTGQELE